MSMDTIKEGLIGEWLVGGEPDGLSLCVCDFHIAWHPGFDTVAHW